MLLSHLCRSTHRALSSLSPFHLAIPVHDLALAREFYGSTLGFPPGRSSIRWQDYSAFGHQLVCHEVSSDYRAVDYFNPVDRDDVPVPHFGLVLELEAFHAFVEELQHAQIQFQIEPHVRFAGSAGEQWTMFFKDPSGNNLEFKAMTSRENLFTPC